MAPFTISPHHPLPHQCRLPQEAPFMQSKMSPELSSSKPGAHEDLPLNCFQIRLHLWEVIRRVVNCCASVAKLFCSKIFFFICVGNTMAMTGELKKSGVEALEREIGGGEDPEMELDDAVEREEEEGDEARLSEWGSDEETDEEEEEDEDNEEEGCEPQDVDSEWSDEDDDDEGDSEASAESLELWESFLNSSDPYNPLSFCSSTGSRTNTKQNQLTQTQPSPATRPEESHPKTSSKEGGKKVCFGEVTVHPLVAWSSASRLARDGSCWLQMARDRERFRRRVENIGSVIKPCLTPEHRAGVWEKLQRKTLS